MRDMIHEGARWLEGQRRRYMAVRVSYKAAGSMFERQMPATVGLSRFETVDAAGQMIRYETRDYFLSVEDQPTPPAKGDKITEMIDGNAHTYLVAGPPGGGNVWTWADRGQRCRRVYTHRIGGD